MYTKAIKTAKFPFHIIIKPIGAVCNLNCSYCYYLDKKSLYPGIKSFRMTEEVLKNFIQQYIESQPESVKELHFSWQGGEPTLLGINFFRQAVKFQKQFCRNGMRITNAFQTNGTLLDENWGKFFHDENFLIGISIDGPEDIHNFYRCDPKGKGSFKDVMRGLNVLIKEKVEFNTLTVVNNQNENLPKKIYDFLKNSGAIFFQFIPIVERNSDDSISNESVGPQQWGNFLSGIFDKWIKFDIGKVFVQHFDVFLGLYMGMPSSLCVHAETCGKAAALEYNGDLYSCDHFVFKENYLGNISELTLNDMIDGQKQIDFGNNKKDRLPRFCLKCNYLRLCHGGCPAHRFSSAPGGESGLNYLCPGFIKFFSHSLPYFQAMSKCLYSGHAAKDYQIYMETNSSSKQKKPGRNDPCPCGSGKKYKNCHGH
jgi:uncharacterized protein